MGMRYVGASFYKCEASLRFGVIIAALLTLASANLD